MENSSVLFKDPELDRLAASISARELLIQAGGSFSGYSRANLSLALEQGKELIQAKGLLKHGEFTIWCKTAPNFIHRVSKETICLYMKLNKNIEKIKDHCQKCNVTFSELSIYAARKIITDKVKKNETKIDLKNGSFAWLSIKKSGCTIRLSEEDEAWVLDKISIEKGGK